MRVKTGIPPHRWRDPATWARLSEQVLPRTWHCIGSDQDVREPGRISPRTLLPGSLDEPLVVVNDGGTLRAFANVCTHRLATLVEAPMSARALRCPYHGRTFGLDGRCRAQRGFSGVVEGFPAEADHLVPVALARWSGLLFASLAPERPFRDAMGALGPLLDVLPLATGTWEEGPEYAVEGPLVAWIGNYLEGLHVPFVHPALGRVLLGEDYAVRVLEGGNSLQVGVVGAEEPALDLPAGHPEAARRVGGLYGCLFPCTFLNVYPWGLSLNLVQPLGPWRTRIRYASVVVDPALRQRGAGAALDVVEAEDQAIVARVARGLAARSAGAPRFAPGHEDAVAAWHEAMERWLGP